MTTLFMDSSGLLKIYLAERGSAWLKNYVVGKRIAISELALYECINVARRIFTEGRFTRQQAIDFITQIAADSTAFQVVPLGGEIQRDFLANIVLDLPSTIMIRTLDSIHVAAAQVTLDLLKTIDPTQTFVFISSDAQLLRAAQAQGFTTENPEDHP